MKTTGKYSHKKYKCRECNQTELHGTNHWGAIYPFCSNCRTITIWDCMEPIPEGYQMPVEWEIVKLGDICEIK